MLAVRPMKTLRPPDTPLQHWQLILDQRVREAELEAEIEVRRLEEDLKVLVQRTGKVEAGLDRMGESEERVKAHRTLGRWWGWGFALVSTVLIVTAWWTFNWYLSLTWEKVLLSMTVFILPVIGWPAFLLYRKEKAELSWRTLCGLGLAMVVCSVVALSLLNAGRMAGVLLEEERQQTQATGTSGELGAASEPSSGPRIERVQKFQSVATMVAVILLGIAGEIGAGLTFHGYYRHMTIVWTVWPYYREQSALSDAIADNIAKQEAAKRQPEILRAQLTAAGLMAEATQIEKAAAEARAAAEQEAAQTRADARAAAQAVKNANSLGRVVGIVMVCCLVTVFLLVLVACVFAEERHVQVVVLDLSGSMAQEEFSRNLLAVEGIITRLEPESRFVVLGVTEQSFSAAPLFVETSPKTTGRFGEYLGAWRAKVVREWRRVAEHLRPSAKGSDLLGALVRASTEFEELPQASKTLIILSDMRQVGRGLNLENGRTRPALRTLEAQGLVPRLDAVRVWMLGVHTSGIDIEHWRSLKMFWTQYFEKSGGQVKAFSPNRRVPAL